MPPAQPVRAPGALSDAWAKLRWGCRHINTFRDQWRELYADQNPLSTETRLNGKKDALIVRVKSIKEVPDPLSLVVGDAVHDIRCALDHLVWRLALMERKGRQPRNRNLAFPLADNPDDFRRHRVQRQLKEVHPHHRALIERMQPYRQVFVGDTVHPVTRLINMSNKDKHRRLHLIDLVLVKARLLYENAVDCEVLGSTVDPQERPLKVDDEIGRFHIRPTGEDPHVERTGLDCTLDLAVHGVIPLGVRLDAMVDYVAYVLRTFEPIFPAAKGAAKG